MIMFYMTMSKSHRASVAVLNPIACRAEPKPCQNPLAPGTLQIISPPATHRIPFSPRDGLVLDHPWSPSERHRLRDASNPSQNTGGIVVSCPEAVVISPQLDRVVAQP